MIVCSLCKPILSLNVWLQIEHVNLECAESDDEALALVFRSLRLLSALQMLFDSNCAALLLMRHPTLFDPVQPVPRTHIIPMTKKPFHQKFGHNKKYMLNIL